MSLSYGDAGAISVEYVTVADFKVAPVWIQGMYPDGWVTIYPRCVMQPDIDG